MNYADIHGNNGILEQSNEMDQSQEQINANSNETSLQYIQAIDNFKKLTGLKSKLKDNEKVQKQIDKVFQNTDTTNVTFKRVGP